MSAPQPPRHVVIAGAGPAGLTAAFELVRRGLRPVVLEMDGIVGGLARTNQHSGYRFDLGGHRFFTRIERVNRIWEDLLGERFLRVRRLSRIYYRGRFFDYPLRMGNVLRGLGPLESLLIAASFLRSVAAPSAREDNLEDWVSNRFGKRLYQAFFKSYTEKVWGMPCSRIPAEWAAQRIKGLSLRTALLNAMFGNRRNKIKSLIEEFRYPELGPGMMWEAMRDDIVRGGGSVLLHREVRRILVRGRRVAAFVAGRPGGGEERFDGSHFVASMPVTELIARMDPSPPAPVVESARRLRHRDFLTVCLILDRPGLFPDNWIYIQDAEQRMGRLQNFGNWSARMLADPSRSSLGAEYFVNEGDDLWTMPDAELLRLAEAELRCVNLIGSTRVQDGVVYRQKKAYPVYDHDYRENLGRIRAFLGELENLQLVGRNGLHRYNNQDHSMLTALLAVENLFGARHDVWSVNTDDRYHEESETR